MLDVSLIFKLGAMGVLIIVIDKVLKASGKDDIAVITNIAGIVIILITLIGLISDLFSAVRTMFMF
ncbi:stage III sporulation protein AC [Clostridium isatidis]|uniref:Stage III sporulation protein AC n=1 Tax=Clostridium isatidis TaxID=182773 RepID=A0A343JAX3_9CLOT|nr:stage III sporulation protein AC [Clostridium isatidis]ASW42681.1 stage III sporulation protein AC [Clostridium isatidis]NLZ33622.1 stage III sporulation protein AC [Clostridiales bacterium]